MNGFILVYVSTDQSVIRHVGMSAYLRVYKTA